MHAVFPRKHHGIPGSFNSIRCDGSHKDTPFKPVRWIVPDHGQALYSICGCKHTKDAPYCDSMHNEVGVNIVKRLENCQEDHEGKKLCVKCGHADGLPDIKGK